MLISMHHCHPCTSTVASSMQQAKSQALPPTQAAGCKAAINKSSRPIACALSLSFFVGFGYVLTKHGEDTTTVYMHGGCLLQGGCSTPAPLSVAARQMDKPTCPSGASSVFLQGLGYATPWTGGTIAARLLSAPPLRGCRSVPWQQPGQPLGCSHRQPTPRAQSSRHPRSAGQ